MNRYRTLENLGWYNDRRMDNANRICYGYGSVPNVYDGVQQGKPTIRRADRRDDAEEQRVRR